MGGRETKTFLSPVDDLGAFLPWRASGVYLESCNCEAICPCRRVGATAGGRSTYGVCLGILSWLIDHGTAGETDLTGVTAALTYRYDDDEPGSPWEFVFYVDERASAEQCAAVSGILLGRLGGPHILELPWIRKASTLQRSESRRIEVRHGGANHSLRIDAVAELRASRAVDTAERVTCIVPGHDTPGTELYADRLSVRDPPFVFDLAGNCSFTAPFDYASG